MDIFAFVEFLSRRRTVFIFLFFLLWLVLLDLLWLLPTQKSVRSSASELSMQVAENASSDISTSLEAVLAKVQDAALDMQAEPDRSKMIIDRLLQRNPSFTHAAVVEHYGSEMVSSHLHAGQDDMRDYSKLSGLYLALAGSSSFGDVTRDEDGRPTSVVTVPIVRASGIHSVLAVDVNLERFTEIVGLPKTDTWRVYITDHAGLEILDPDSSRAAGGHNLLNRPIVQKVAVDGQAVDGLATEDSYADDRGVRMFAVGIPIPIANWGLFVERPQSEALREATVVTWLAVAIFILGLFAIIVALWSYWHQAVLNDRLSAQGIDLLEKNTRLQELDKIKSEFISVAAHQLRTPLSAIKWTLGILIDEQSQNLTPQQRSLLMKGFESNERMLKLINEMLVVTRIESGKIRLAFAPIHIEDLIESTVLDFASQAHVRKIALTFDPPKERLPFISADSEQIRNVIQNLIENSAQYTLEGGSIRLSASATDHMVKVNVTDTGIGIPQRQQSSIFNKFFRADNAARQQTDGSGLGLFIAKSIVEKHGGRLTFESEEGKGTTFTFTIPVSTNPART
ncbi:MAG: sensor histidine kinase [Patescibacteria group bacterium]